MSKPNERGARDLRGSALWGTGGRGGDRSSVLWGKGGRGMVVAALATLALALPFAATAGSGKAPNVGGGFIAPSLLNAKGQVDVIITSTSGLADANAKLTGLGVFQKEVKQLGLINGVEAKVPAAQLKKLQGIPGIVVTPNATVKLTSMPYSMQAWPYVTGNAFAWYGDMTTYAGKAPAIAIVDSGIQHRSDFGSRVIADVNLSTMTGNTDADTGTTDQRGHGTFVAGMAAGNAPGLAGAAPGAPLVDVKVMNNQGQALTSDVITACQWILDHKAQYNIRVANFSLHSSYGTNFYRDPLDQAVEKLWFGGITVVAAAGNYGNTDGTPSGVLYAPGNDPFVITVGAFDGKAGDEAPWSAFGYTEDGFFKPDLSAPGRYMIGPVPADSTLAAERPDKLVGTDKMQLSGTSFSAPIVAGTVADMLARHPNWTPDQVKGALLFTTRGVRAANPRAVGVGELVASRAIATPYAPNPNLGLDQFVAIPSGGTSPVFDAMSWASTASANMSWNSMSWNSQSWSDQSWSDQSWASMSWSDQSWSDMSWTDQSWSDMSWTDMSWTDSSKEDAAESDGGSVVTDGYAATDTTAAAAAADPDVAVFVDGIDPLTALGLPPAPPPVTTSTDTTSTVTTSTDTTSTDTTTTTPSP